MKQKCTPRCSCTTTISVGAEAEVVAPFCASVARPVVLLPDLHPAPVQFPPRAFLKRWLSHYCCKCFVMTLTLKKDWGVESQLLLHTVVYRCEVTFTKLYFLSCGLCSHLTASLSSPEDCYISSFHFQRFFKRFLWGSSQKVVVKVALSQNSLFPRTLENQTYHLLWTFHLPQSLLIKTPLPHSGIFMKGLLWLKKIIRIYWDKAGMFLANANNAASRYFSRSNDFSESRQDCYLFPATKNKQF